MLIFCEPIFFFAPLPHPHLTAFFDMSTLAAQPAHPLAWVGPGLVQAPRVFADSQADRALTVAGYRFLVEVYREAVKEGRQTTIVLPAVAISGYRPATQVFDEVARSLAALQILVTEEMSRALYSPQQKEYGSRMLFAPFHKASYKSGKMNIEVDPDFYRLFDHFQLLSGDYEHIRSFATRYSFPFYWIARSAQRKNKTLLMEIEEFREKICLENGKFSRMQQLGCFVIQKIQDDFEGHWTEFTYRFWRDPKSGIAPRAYSHIEFTFKNGPEEEQGHPAGTGLPWERDLLNFGVSAKQVVRFRALVANQHRNTQKGFLLDDHHIHYSIQAFKQKLAAQIKQPKKRGIQNTGAYLSSGITEGYWLEYVNQMRQLQTDALPSTIEIPARPAPVVSPVSTISDEVIGWQEFYNDLPHPKVSFVDFMALNGYQYIDGAFVKKPNQKKNGD
jgi:hypothetical protein